MKRFRFAYLLASLALVVFLRPFLTERVLGLAIVDLLLLITLLAGAFATIGQRHLLIPVALLGLASAAAQSASHLTGAPAATVAFLIAGLLFYGSVAWALLAALFARQQRVTGDTLCQAMAAYLLLGMIGAMAYALLELAAPGSFRFPAAGEGAGATGRFDRFLGFSFTTLTTLGYGNIAPASPRADALTTLQAFTGQIYLAVVIARLVAIEVGQRAAPAPEAPGARRPRD